MLGRVFINYRDGSKLFSLVIKPCFQVPPWWFFLRLAVEILVVLSFAAIAEDPGCEHGQRPDVRERTLLASFTAIFGPPVLPTRPGSAVRQLAQRTV